MIYELIEELENCTHAKVNFVIDETFVNADLGVYVEVEGEQQFEAQYTSAVVAKTNLLDYEEESV